MAGPPWPGVPVTANRLWLCCTPRRGGWPRSRWPSTGRTPPGGPWTGCPPPTRPGPCCWPGWPAARAGCGPGWPRWTGCPAASRPRPSASLSGELYLLEEGIPRSERLPRRRGSLQPEPGRVLHLVTDALPTTNAGYTVRTQQIAVAQQQAGLDPHVVTKAGFPVAQGHLDGRRVALVNGVPYHRLLPYRLPPRADAAASLGHDLAARLAGRLRPAVLHAASNHLNGQLALALREDFGLPVIYEARGFWEETWLSRHGGDPGDPAAQDAGRPAPSQPVNETRSSAGGGQRGCGGHRRRVRSRAGRRGSGAATRDRPGQQRLLPAEPGGRDPLHGRSRPGRHAGRGHARGDRGPGD